MYEPNMSKTVHLLRSLTRKCSSQSLAIQKKIEKVSNVKQNIPTLFVPCRYGDDVYQIVKPIIDADFLSRYAEDIQRSCDCRNLSLDVRSIADIASKWERLRDTTQKTGRRYGEIVSKLQELEQSDPRQEHLTRESTCLADELAVLRSDFQEMEDFAMPLFQSIPNTLHPLTPVNQDVHRLAIPPKERVFGVRSHVDIGRNGFLKFSDISPPAYYLLGELAELEQALLNFFECRLQFSNSVPLSSVDFCKSFILEACGKDPYSEKDSIIIKHGGRKIGQKHHLTGGASFEALCAYFVNMNANKVNLPMRYHTIGRLYCPQYKNKAPSLFSTVQSTAVHSFIVSEPSHADHCYDSLKNLISMCISQLGLPYRTVDVSASNLNAVESRKVCFELWSPVLQDYVMCSYVSQCGEFVSKRLQMTYGTDFEVEGHLNIVHGMVNRIPVVLGCIMENLQNSDGSFTIPDMLKSYIISKQ